MVFHTDRKLFAYSFLFGLAPLHFISAGNYSRKVSCPTWHHSISYRQETFCEGFPVRLGSMVLLTHRKLLAKGFPFDLAPWRFLPTGNYSRRVSCPTWLHGFPYRQETFCLWFPVRLDSMVFHTDRKLFAYGFLSGLAPWYSLPTGNCSPIVSCPPWLHGVSYPQETVREGFPVRLGSMAFLTPQETVREGFPIRLDSMLFLTPQETVREGFPIRLGSMAFLAHRKLFAKGFLFSLAPWCSLPTGNFSLPLLPL